LAQDEIRRLVEELSDHFEGRIEGKTPWRTDKMTASTMEKMLIQIVPFRFEIEDVQGTWKLNQNKPDTARLPAAAQVETSPLGLGTGALASLMRSVPTD
jgi:transcriptional regulator